MKHPPLPLNLYIQDFDTAANRAGNVVVTYGASQACKWLPLMITFSLTCGIVVADRFPYLEIYSGLTLKGRYAAILPQTAVSTVQWSFIVDAEAMFSLTGANGVVNLSSMNFLQGNETIQFGVLNGDAGDDITNIRIRVGLAQQPYNI